MFNVCPGCGMYSVEKDIDPIESVAICPSCGHRHPFLRMPLFVLTGASGSGKTTVCLGLSAALPECVVLESDILWRPEFARPENDWREYRELWLRVAKNVGQGGRPVVLGGTALPDQFETCPERRYFATIHYLALVCDDDVLASRLEARPPWRKSGSPDFVERMVGFNRWLVDNANLTNPPLTLLDTTDWTTDDTVGQVAAWIRSRLGAFGTRKARNENARGTKGTWAPSSSRSFGDLE
jgi:predicted kinase